MNVSPLLFTILYTDDSKLFLTGKNVATLIDIMNKETSEIIEWLHSNKLSPNVNKIQYMIFAHEILSQRLRVRGGVGPMWHSLGMV